MRKWSSPGVRVSRSSSFGRDRIDETGSALVILLLGILIIGVLVGISLLALRGGDSPQSVIESAQKYVDEGGRVEPSETACATEKTMIETAQELFLAVHGRYASDTEALVEDGLLRSEPERYETSGTAADFFITPMEGAGCD